jgi:coenzyme F420-reducing hydrogenase beta subunit
LENPKFNFQPRILHSSNNELRYKGSSGGVITHIIEYLFKTKQVNCSLNFKFSGLNLFEPTLIHSYLDYIHSGSVYHDINLYNFIKENILKIEPPIVISCLPCQVLPIRRLLNKKGIESIIISLVCSGQLEKEATYYFLKKNNIDISKVTNFRYRGNGWPSGMQITTDSNKYFFHNNNSKWLDIFHSQVFTLNRCFSCKDTFGMLADFTIADPWLERYVKNDKIGSSITVAHNENAEKLILDMIENKKLDLVEEISNDETIFSQKGTIQKKYIFIKYKVLIRLLVKIFKSKYYKKYFFYFSTLHRKIFFKLISFLKKIQGLK